MRLKLARLVGSATILGVSTLFNTQAQEAAYLPPDGGYDVQSDWNDDAETVESLENPTDPADWNHDNGSDQWEGTLGILTGEMPGGVELLEQDGATFLRFQDARTEGGSGDNRKIMFSKTAFEEGTDPLDVDEGSGATLHVRLRLAVPAQQLPLEDQLDGGPWPAEGDGTRVRFGGKGSMGIDTTTGTFGFALGTADADEGLVDADGEGADGLMLNGVTGGDEDGNLFAIPLEELVNWQEFWIQIIPEEGEEGSTHKVTLFHNGSEEGVEFFITPGDGNIGGAPEPSIYFGHAATDQRGAFDLDFLHVKEGIHDPVPALGSDPNVIWSRRSDLGQLPTVPPTAEGVVNIRNNGETNALTLSDFTVSGADADHVTVSESPSEIPPGGVAELKYIFDSKGETGAFNATINFKTNDPDTPDSAIAVSAAVINTAGPGGHYPLDDVENEDALIADITGYDRPGNYNPGDGSVSFGKDALVTGTAVDVAGGGTLLVPVRKFGDITNYTAAFWINLSAFPEVLGAVVSRASITDANPATSLLVTPDGGFWWLAPDVSEDPLFTIEPTIELGTTYHIAVVSEGDHDTVSVYINGTLANSGSGLGQANPSEPGEFFFGAFGPLASTGTYDDLQIYTKALSAEDVKWLADNPGAVIGGGGDPCLNDSDDDGLNDCEEGDLGTDPLEADTDGDALTDGDEVNTHTTDPLNPDTDGDEREDGAEVAAGTDPLDPLDPPKAPTGSLVDNIVALWPLDEADGSVAADAVGAHDGAVMGTAEWKPAEGRVGGAIFFDGSDGFIEVPDAPDFQFAEEQSWTASLWYKTDVVENDQGLITKGYHDDSRATTGYWMLQTRADGFTLDSRCCEGGNPRARIDSDSGISHGDGEWHHFVVARDGAAQEIRLYVDGQLTTTDVSGVDRGLWAMGENEDPLVIANHFNRFTAGWFDDIAVWKGYALTDADVAAIAAEGVAAALENAGPGVGEPVELAVVESGLDGDEPAVVENAAYAEDALTFSDRTHEHNGAAFDSATGTLATGGDLVIDLPDYLVGQSYIRFANNARDNAEFEAVVTASGPAKWYLLIDNRLDGPNAASKGNTEDPILGGTLQWVIDGGWQRVNTGISPGGLADYVGVDESGDGGLNQFYAVYTLPDASTTVTINGNGIGGTNMLSLVGAGAGGGDDNPFGLLGYWRLDEQGGVAAVDSSGNGNNGVVESADNAWIADPDRGSVYQSGGGSYIDFGTILPVIGLETDFTWSFWVKPNETDNNNIVFGNRWSPDGTDFAPREFIKFTPRVFEWHFNSGGENVPGDNTLFVVDQWTHNLVVKSGTTLTYYRDGVEVASSEITGAPVNAQPLYLGGQNGNENFSGLFDEVAVMDRALSPAEVTEVYNRGVAGESLIGPGDGVDPGPGDDVPPLEDVGITDNGVFGVTIPAGMTADIEYSTDLESWEVIATDLTGSVEETDAGRIAAPKGYYRAIYK